MGFLVFLLIDFVVPGRFCKSVQHFRPHEMIASSDESSGHTSQANRLVGHHGLAGPSVPASQNQHREPRSLLLRNNAYQCVSPAGICTTSPTCSFLGFSPLLQIRPVPIVTVRIWPRSCVCQYVRAPGVKQTLFPMQSSALKMGSLSADISFVVVRGAGHVDCLRRTCGPYPRRSR